jgi:hypothetical protein
MRDLDRDLPEQYERVLIEAQRVSTEQSERAHRGEPAIQPAAIVHRLVNVAKKPAPSRSAARTVEHVVRTPDGVVLARGQKAGRGGGIAISLPAPAKDERAALLAALDELLDRVAPSARPKPSEEG